MMTIEKGIKQFKENLEAKLPEDQFDEYLWALDLFEDYLAHYSSVSKSNPDPDYSEVLLTGNINEISVKEIEEFLHVFVIRKVSSTSDEMKVYLSLMGKFAEWLGTNSLITKEMTDDLKKSIKAAELLPVTARISEHLFEISKNNVIRKYSEIITGNFVVDNINKFQVTLKDRKTDRVLKPLLLTNDITSMLKDGMILHLEVGLCDEGWVIIEAGNVYLRWLD